MKKDKCPGLDGLTIEALLLVWTDIRTDCFEMIDHFWSSGTLIQGQRTAVIKLVPKNEHKRRLKNWRPLSLMPLTYKIITKIIAERIKTFMPQLVDMQQVGFIQGRDIASNLLSLRLGSLGSEINDNDSLLHQLFADDTGVCLKLDENVFIQTRNIIATYEKASGAKLNLDKSTLIPLFDGPIPAVGLPHWMPCRDPG
ncbi:hypothetical protein R1sor_009054 [Riccia sorocarpa]|uniref:Reverse transcriptase domain-containing protein n=1 Tax=Riccia sorocarpa TaxID=122646 RepID=A0ABD3H878_9MARC